MSESSEKVEMIDLSFGGRYLSTTRKIALEGGKECLMNSFPNQALLPQSSKKGCILGGEGRIRSRLGF